VWGVERFQTFSVNAGIDSVNETLSGERHLSPGEPRPQIFVSVILILFFHHEGHEGHEGRFLQKGAPGCPTAFVLFVFFVVKQEI